MLKVVDVYHRQCKDTTDIWDHSTADSQRICYASKTNNRNSPHLPAAERAGITKRIGWHSFRRTLATLLQSSGASVKTTQELMRHASPGITMGIYAKAVTADIVEGVAIALTGGAAAPVVALAF